MNEAVQPNKVAQQTRCPACSAPVRLPAETCPDCLHDLRGNQKPSPEHGETGGRAGDWLVCGLVLAAVLALAFVFLFQAGEPATTAPALPPTAAAVPSSEIGEALATLTEEAPEPVTEAAE